MTMRAHKRSSILNRGRGLPYLKHGGGIYPFSSILKVEKGYSLPGPHKGKRTWQGSPKVDEKICGKDRQDEGVRLYTMVQADLVLSGQGIDNLRARQRRQRTISFSISHQHGSEDLKASRYDERSQRCRAPRAVKEDTYTYIKA
jgi:hypothetical protein